MCWGETGEPEWRTEPQVTEPQEPQSPLLARLGHNIWVRGAEWRGPGVQQNEMHSQFCPFLFVSLGRSPGFMEQL